MVAKAASFEVEGASVARIVEHFGRAADSVESPSGSLVFCSGAVADQLDAIATALHDAYPELPITLVSGLGVLSERGELEDTSAVTGLLWRGGRYQTQTTTAEEVGASELEQLLSSTDDAHPTTLLFVRSEGFDPAPLWQARRRCSSRHIFGAGTYGEPGIICCNDAGPARVSGVAIRLPDLAMPSIRTSHACRLLSEPMRITESEGALVLGIDGEPALSVLERLGSTLEDQPLVFTVLAEAAPEPASQGELLVRGIQGIDPDRKGLLVSDEIKEDMLITFGVRDPSAARQQMEATCRRVSREIAGGAPRFGIYLNCAGRGQSLHQSPNVDTRALRERFGPLPIAGFQSAFEIAPFGSGPALQLYTGVLAVFCAPS